jgi:hypothetical protein
MFDKFSENSKVWIYPSNRILSTDDEKVIRKHLEEFTKKWNAHGSPVKGTFEIYKSNFIVLVADETQSAVSGCSIDSSVKTVKTIGNELKIDFFNRLLIVIEKDGEIKRVTLDNISNEIGAFIYDTSVSNLYDFRTKFKIPQEVYLERFIVK